MVMWILLLCPGLAGAQFVEPDVEVIRLLSGTQDGDYFGWVLGNVGDIDGDGVDEVLVPAIARDGFAGQVTLYSGSDGQILNVVDGAPGAALGYGVGAAGDVDGDNILDYIVGGGQVLVISGADHRVIHDVGSVTGFSDGVAGIGDVDGDGYDDIAVGAQRDITGGADAGRLFVFSGDDASLLWSREGQAGDALGSAVGALGDVTGDGVPDLVVGASGAGPSGGGEAYVLSGGDGALIYTLRPGDEATADQFGQFFASGAGDINGDGVGDVYVGDLNAEGGRGAAYIFSGRNGRRLHWIRGLKAGEGFGLGRGIPDVNGDGLGDVLVGAYNNSDGAPNAGALYLFDGRSGALLRTVTANVASDNFGGDAIAAGDVNGDGLPDFVVSAPGLSFLGLDHGRAYVIGGSVLPCPADLNGNGWVLIRDIILLRQAFGDTDSPADLNGDGVVDGHDLWVMVRSLGRCAPGFPS